MIDIIYYILVFGALFLVVWLFDKLARALAGRFGFWARLVAWWHSEEDGEE